MNWTILNDFLFSIIVDNLPNRTQIYSGAGSMTSKTGDGVYLRAGEYLFLFTCNESSCQWTTVLNGLEGMLRPGSGFMMPFPSAVQWDWCNPRK